MYIHAASTNTDRQARNIDETTDEIPIIAIVSALLPYLLNEAINKNKPTTNAKIANTFTIFEITLFIEIRFDFANIGNKNMTYKPF